MISNALLTETLSSVLSQAGFRKRTDTWYRDVPVGLMVVDIQKSDWGDQYYVNLGIYARDLGDARWPLSNQCHLNTRAEVIDTSEQEHWLWLLDMQNVIDPGTRRRELERLLVMQVLPFLESLSTVESMRSAYLSGALAHAGVMLALKRLLQVT